MGTVPPPSRSHRLLHTWGHRLTTPAPLCQTLPLGGPSPTCPCAPSPGQGPWNVVNARRTDAVGTRHAWAPAGFPSNAPEQGRPRPRGTQTVTVTPLPPRGPAFPGRPEPVSETSGGADHLRQRRRLVGAPRPDAPSPTSLPAGHTQRPAPPPRGPTHALSKPGEGRCPGSGSAASGRSRGTPGLRRAGHGPHDAE